MTNEHFEIYLTSLSHDGRAIGRVPTQQGREQVVFVQGALPGQRVIARITKAKKNFAEGVCVELLEQAKDFINPECAHAGKCGGCPLQAMPYDKQLYWKQEILKQSLQRIGKLKQIPDITMYPSPKIWEYRNKMEFAVGMSQNNELSLGLRAYASHDVVPTPKCMLMPKACQDILESLRLAMVQTGLGPWQGEHEGQEGTANENIALFRHVIIRKANFKPSQEGKNTKYHVQIITAPSSAENYAKINALGQKLLQLPLGVVGFAHTERASDTLYAQGERQVCALGEEYLQEQVVDVNYTLHYDSFFQVNSYAAAHLFNEAKSMAELSGEEIVWDIYCGVGAPSLDFATNAKVLYGVESNANSISMAKKNAEKLGCNHCHYVAGLAENVMAKSHKKNNLAKQSWPKPHVIIADPPRAGLHTKVVQSILANKPQRIVYVSCNPATFARDIALLQGDYELVRLSAVDLFPHTAHVESLALLISRH